MVSSPAQRSGVSVAEEEGAQIDNVSKMCLRDVYQWRRYERQTGRQMCIMISCEEGEISSLPGYEMQKTPPPKSPPKAGQTRVILHWCAMCIDFRGNNSNNNCGARQGRDDWRTLAANKGTLLSEA